MAHVPDANDSLPIIPHESVGGVDCCGCLIVEARGDNADIIRNECGALISTVPAANVGSAMMQMLLAGPICSATCPHCGALKTFPGFSTVEAFIFGREDCRRNATH